MLRHCRKIILRNPLHPEKIGDVGEKILEFLQLLNFKPRLKEIMRIIPAIDIIDGNVFTYRKAITIPKLYTTKTRLVAKEFEAHGIEFLHLVDLDGANKIVNYKILEQIASQTSLKIDFGGGLKSDADLKLLLKPIKSTGGSMCCEKQSCIREVDC
jgi:phosphoribosylformimino-5-aminoimidazole carboxamide ribonucleotide (ProFAR) isomerase